MTSSPSISTRRRSRPWLATSPTTRMATGPSRASCSLSSGMCSRTTSSSSATTPSSRSCGRTSTKPARSSTLTRKQNSDAQRREQGQMSSGSKSLHLRGCACCGVSGTRRSFLARAAAATAAAVLPRTPALAQDKTLIDTHHHFYPPEYQKLWLDWEEARKIPHFPGQVAWSKAKALEDMDKAGISTGVLSL